MRHQDNHLKLSRKIHDPVSAIGEAGTEVSVALRNDYLNRANRFIQLFFFGFDKEEERPMTQKYLKGLVKTEALTFASAGVAIPSTLAFPLVCLYYTTTKNYRLFYKESSEYIPLLTGERPYEKQGFTIINNLIHAWFNGAVLTTGDGVLYFIQSDQQTESDANPAIDSLWDDVLVDLAAVYHFEDKGALDFAAAQAKRTQMVMSVIAR